ncbi:MAG: low affinity iron permease family protein [Chryseolinea sp.]
MKPRRSGNASENEADELYLHAEDKKVPLFDRISKVVTRATGRPAAFITAFVVILVWAISGPLFGFSDTWQLVINTGTTIITFLMVFVIQQSQNKDTMAIQLKLNELIASQKTASNRLIDIEDLSEKELQTLKRFYIKLSTLAENEKDLYSSHSLDEADKIHKSKSRKATTPGQ